MEIGIDMRGMKGEEGEEMRKNQEETEMREEELPFHHLGVKVILKPILSGS